MSLTAEAVLSSPSAVARFAMRYDTASATYTLQLKDVQRSDEGR